MQDVADKFNNFFTEKIEKIRSGLEAHQSYTTTNDYNTDNFTGTPLTKFDPATLPELKEVLTESTIKTSSNDPLPLDVTKENMDILLPHILNIVNLSLSSGSIDGLKTAHISPLIKGSTLDTDNLINYRPMAISNLSFIGKIIERIVLRRLNKHLTINNLHKDNQSGYKKFHSTETLLIRIVNDLLIASDKDKATVVMLLDLSAAFDTVDHEKLLKILKYDIGVRDTALQWFRSFLIDRSQKVKLGLNESDEIEIKYGVPQGSVLGPVLFNLYIGSLHMLCNSLYMVLLMITKYTRAFIINNNTL